MSIFQWSVLYAIGAMTFGGFAYFTYRQKQGFGERAFGSLFAGAIWPILALACVVGGLYGIWSGFAIADRFLRMKRRS